MKIIKKGNNPVRTIIDLAFPTTQLSSAIVFGASESLGRRRTVVFNLEAGARCPALCSSRRDLQGRRGEPHGDTGGALDHVACFRTATGKPVRSPR